MISDYDFQVFTDGSCDYRDGIMGYAAVIYSAQDGVMITRGGTSTGGSVRRAEMMGLLVGLQAVGQLSGVLVPEHRKTLTQNSVTRPKVMWYTDRQDVAGSISPPAGQKAFNRDKDADLWAQISWWETWLKIHANLKPRNTLSAQAECDRIAGELRKCLKSKMESWVSDEKNPTYLA